MAPEYCQEKLDHILNVRFSNSGDEWAKRERKHDSLESKQVKKGNEFIVIEFTGIIPIPPPGFTTRLLLECPGNPKVIPG